MRSLTVADDSDPELIALANVNEEMIFVSR